MVVEVFGALAECTRVPTGADLGHGQCRSIAIWVGEALISRGLADTRRADVPCCCIKRQNQGNTIAGAGRASMRRTGALGKKQGPMLSEHAAKAVGIGDLLLDCEVSKRESCDA